MKIVVLTLSVGHASKPSKNDLAKINKVLSFYIPSQEPIDNISALFVSIPKN